MKQKKIMTTVKAIALVALLTWIVQSTNWDEVFLYMQNAHWGYLLLFALFHFLGLLCSAKKWSLIASWAQFENSYGFYVKKYIIGAFINNFLPSFVGGDTYRIIVLAKTGENVGSDESDKKNQKPAYRKSSQTVILDRLSGLITIYMLSLLFGTVFVVGQGGDRSGVVITIGILWVVAVVGLGFLLMLTKSSFGVGISALLPAKVMRYIRTLRDGVTISHGFQMFSWSALFAFSGVALAHYMLFYAIGVDVGFWSFMSVIFLVSILATAPISIGNIGVKEALYVFFFGFFGISLSACIAVVLLSRFMQMAISLLAIPFYLTDDRSSASTPKS